MEKNVFRLKEIMNEKGISRDALAQGMGVAPATISNISTGRVYPSVKFLLELSEYLDVDIREMFISTKGDVLSKGEIKELTLILESGISLLKGKNN